MEIKFTTAIPDEPYKNTFEKNKTAEITYNGPAFLILTYDPKTNVVQNIDGHFDSREEINLDDFSDDRFSFTVLDVEKNTLIACIISNYYYHDEIEPFEETLVTGEIYKFDYAPNGCLDDIYNRWKLKYNPLDDTYSAPVRTHDLTRDQFLQNLSAYVARCTILLNEKDINEEKINKIKEVIDWCEKFEETYSDTDHWKIRFPTVE